MAPAIISANIGFLYQDLALCERIAAARADGFGAVEMHFPYDTDAAETKRALKDCGLACICINTRPGDMAAGDFGLAAVPGREAEARAAIDEAFDYARAIGAAHVHVMAGKAQARADARRTFLENLRHACALGQRSGAGVLIEPINAGDAPGYYLTEPAAAGDIIAQLDAGNIRMMLDLYHAAIQGHDPVQAWHRFRGAVGHVQFAAVPGRGEPDGGDLNMLGVLSDIRMAGYGGAFGAEYRPTGRTRDGLGWLAAFQNALNSIP